MKITLETETDNPKAVTGLLNLLLQNECFRNTVFNLSEKGIDIYQESASEMKVLDFEIRIEDMGFSGRTLKCLKKCQAKTLGDVNEKTAQEIFAIRDAGLITVNEVKDKLGEYGLGLKGYEEFMQERSHQ